MTTRTWNTKIRLPVKQPFPILLASLATLTGPKMKKGNGGKASGVPSTVSRSASIQPSTCGSYLFHSL